MSTVVDIDDTLIETRHRLHGVWKVLLDSEVSMEDIETLSHGDVFMKYASDDQKKRMSEFQQRFWDLLLCEDEMGYELARLDRPIPDASEVLHAWSSDSKIVYLTGRLEGTREFTLSQLREFEFPTENTDLVMYHSSDFSRTRGLGTGPTLVEARARLFGEISKTHRVTRAVDDYPGYFIIYSVQNVPERIGLCISKKYTVKQFMDEGATRVVHTWRELLD
ncbi:MAG: hypothetical protein PVI03_05870 [Candidatus Thorarchaeota archaeon]|jgi:hypothetical protein